MGASSRTYARPAGGWVSRAGTGSGLGVQWGWGEVGALSSSPVGEGSKMDGSLILSRDERGLGYFPLLSTRTGTGRGGEGINPINLRAFLDRSSPGPRPGAGDRAGIREPARVPARERFQSHEGS